MPRRDGSGPMGQGAMTGRGLGLCRGINYERCRYGLGYGLRRGFARGYGRGLGAYNAGRFTVLTDKEILEEQKEFLKRRLDAVNRQLVTFQD